MKIIIKHIEGICKFLDNTEIYLVGGFLRDFVLNINRNYFDFDFALSGDVKSISKKFAKSIDGSWVNLDDVNQTYRVVAKEDFTIQYDFSALRGSNIIEDLKSRDYTVNALGLKIERGSLSADNLIDPCGGLDDIKKRVVRVVSEENLLADPLRVLRGVSIASYLDFDIETLSYELLKKHYSLINNVAGERIGLEIFRLFKNNLSHKYVRILHDLGVLNLIFPGWEGLSNPNPGPYHHLPIDLHSIESLKELETLLKEMSGNKRIEEYLNEKIRENRNRLDVLKLAVLLHDIGKGPAYKVDSDNKIRFTGHEKLGKDILKDVVSKIKISKKEFNMLSDMIYYHLRPGCLVECINESKKAKFRYFRDTDIEAVSIMLLSIADKSATCGELSDLDDIKNHKQVLLDLIEEYFDKIEEIVPPKLINGNDIMKALKIKPSKKIGQILNDVQEKQALGEIKTKKEALKYIKNIDLQ